MRLAIATIRDLWSRCDFRLRPFSRTGDVYVARLYDLRFSPLQVRIGSLRHQPMAVLLDKLQMYSLAFRGSHAYRVRCEAGTLWLTSDNCHQDFVMESGDELSFNAHQKVSIVALPSCTVEFSKLLIGASPDNGMDS